MAELNLVFTVLCKHCGSPLYGRVKFCPHCGKEESVTLVAGAANARRALEHGETADEAETQALACRDTSQTMKEMTVWEGEWS